MDLGEKNTDGGEKLNVLKLDLTIVCDLSKLDDRGCKGNPDMVIEITSPSTARRDKVEKFNKYEQAGINEYWIVEPIEKVVSVFTLQKNKRYGRPDMYTDEDRVNVSIFEDLVIDLSFVFK